MSKEWKISIWFRLENKYITTIHNEIKYSNWNNRPLISCERKQKQILIGLLEKL